MNIAEYEGEASTEAGLHAGSLEMVRSLDIDNADDFAFAGELIKCAKANCKRLDERRTAITKPLLASKRQIDDLFSPALNALKEIEQVLKGKIGAYTLKQTVALAQAMQVSAATYAAGGTPTDIIPEVATTKGVSTKVSWDFEVVNPDLVPREFCTPDRTKIAQAIWYADSPHKPPQPIPGVVFNLRTSVTVRQDK